MASVSALMVVYRGEPDAVRVAVRSLLSQRRAPVEVLVVDNESAGRMARELADEPAVRVIEPGRNLGYPSGINVAAAQARGEYLFCLNPDAEADPDCLDVLARVLDVRPEVALAGAQVLLPDRETVNAGDNPVHLSGLSWSGRYGEARESGPPRSALAVSGAATLIRADAFRELGGFCESFFLYHEDVDLAWRGRIAGFDVVFCPRAAVRHDYEFAKGGYKWMWMERNRLWCVLANYEGRTLLLLAPLLLATEVAILVFAWRSGWLAEKRRAYALLWRDRGLLRQHRTRVAASRRVADAELLEEFEAAFATPLIPVRLGVVNTGMARYRRLVLRALRKNRAPLRP